MATEVKQKTIQCHIPNIFKQHTIGSIFFIVVEKIICVILERNENTVTTEGVHSI